MMKLQVAVQRKPGVAGQLVASRHTTNHFWGQFCSLISGLTLSEIISLVAIQTSSLLALGSWTQ